MAQTVIRILWAIAFTVAIAFALIWTFLADLLMVGANHVLKQRQPDMSLHYDTAQISLLSGELQLNGLALRHSKHPDALLEAEHIALHLQYHDEGTTTFEIVEARVAGLSVESTFAGKTLILAGWPITTPPKDTSPETISSPDALESPDTPLQHWHLNVGQLELSKGWLTPTPLQWSVAQFRARDLALSERTDTGSKVWLQWDQYIAHDLSQASDTSVLNIGSHTWAGLNHSIVIKPDNSIEPFAAWAAIIQALKPKTTATEQETEPSPSPYALALIEFKDANVSLKDERHGDTSFQLAVDASISALQSNNNTTSLGLNHSLALAVKQGDASLKLEGLLSNQTGTLNWSKMKGELSDLDLVPLNPYLKKILGYHINAGHLSVNSQGHIENRVVSSQHRIHLDRIEVEPADEAMADRLNTYLSMPLPLALSILEDDKENIDIELPINGSLDSPDIALDHIAKTVGKKAVKGAILYTIQESFQPYAGLITLGKTIGDQLFAVRLNPIEFEPLSKDLSPEQRKYLAVVAEQMTQNEHYRLTLCGFSSRTEFKTEDEFNDQWQSLAKTRAGNVKDYLITQAPNLKPRIRLCREQPHENIGKVELGVN